MSQGRIERGAEAQNNFATILERYDIPVTSIAKRGSQLPDIIFNVDGIFQQAEVKSTSDYTSITIFDKTITRGKPNPDVDEIVKELRGVDSFERYIDILREQNGKSYAGFVGDEGIENVSGKVPKASFEFKSPIEKNLFIKLIRNHWASSNDDYFVIMKKDGSKFNIYSTGIRRKIIMGTYAVPFDSTLIDEAFLDTAGAGGGIGKLRVALKVTLNTSKINQS
jgi:hypothetical protein